MSRMLVSSAIALALVATLGVHEASAQKGKDRRNPNPIRVQLTATNLTTGESGKNISASAGDEVSISLRVDNRSGEAQNAVVHVVGGIPGCMIDQTVVEFFELSQRKEAEVVGVVPEGESGVLTVDVTVSLPKTSDVVSASGSVAFGGLLKVAAPPNGDLLRRLLLQAVVRSLVTLNDDGQAPVSISEFKELYR